MASVYTTARGKNKKHKASNQEKNGAQCRANKFDADLAKEMGVMKEERETLNLKPTVSGLTSTAYRLRMEHERKLREQALLTCSNPTCPHTKAAEEGNDDEEEDEGDEEEDSEGGGAGGGSSGDRAAKGAAAEPAKLVLQRCACHLASYCSPTCQAQSWEAHKGPCKAKRAEMADIARAIAAARAKAELDAKAAEEALLLELGAEEGAGGSSSSKGRK